MIVSVLTQKLKLQCSLAVSFQINLAPPVSRLPHLISWQPRAPILVGQPRARCQLELLSTSALHRRTTFSSPYVLRLAARHSFGGVL